MITGHGGNIYAVAAQLGCRPSEIIDMSSNMNPLGPMSGLISHLQKRLDTIGTLPDAGAAEATVSFAARYRITPERALAGNGTTQLIYAIPRALKSKRALILGPTYADYADACRLNGVSYEYILSGEDRSFEPDLNALMDSCHRFDTVFICNPNNPTGRLIAADQIKVLCGRHPSVRIIVDESYLSFVAGDGRQSMIGVDLDNLIVLNSMSKIFKIPGLRLGFAIASEEVIKKLRRFIPPWSVNSLALAAVEYLMGHTAEVEQFIQQTTEFVSKESMLLCEKFADHDGIRFYPSTTVFLLGRLKGRLTAPAVKDHLLKEKILIRDCSNFSGLSDRFIRIAVKTEAVKRRMVEALAEL